VWQHWPWMVVDQKRLVCDDAKTGLEPAPYPNHTRSDSTRSSIPHRRTFCKAAQRPDSRAVELRGAARTTSSSHVLPPQAPPGAALGRRAGSAPLVGPVCTSCLTHKRLGPAWPRLRAQTRIAETRPPPGRQGLPNRPMRTTRPPRFSDSCANPNALFSLVKLTLLVKRKLIL